MRLGRSGKQNNNTICNRFQLIGQLATYRLFFCVSLLQLSQLAVPHSHPPLPPNPIHDLVGMPSFPFHPVSSPPSLMRAYVVTPQCKRACSCRHRGDSSHRRSCRTVLFGGRETMPTHEAPNTNRLTAHTARHSPLPVRCCVHFGHLPGPAFTHSQHQRKVPSPRPLPIHAYQPPGGHPLNVLAPSS